ncbi:MAG: HAD-IC family P-type ATPase [Owenweeksia sp.]|nr:HAD-IC family P-type ATPase [Owenweeksia sp.]
MGNETLMQEYNVAIPLVAREKLTDWQQKAHTVLFFACEGSLIAILAVADEVKPNSAQAIAHLKKQGLMIVMLTGDHEKTALAVARQVGIENFKSGMKPADKAAIVREKQASGRIVAMVGDGINDSQALAEADLGIAMGQGSDIAIDVAQITLISSDLQALPKALKLAKQTVKIIRQNLFWAFIYNLVGIPVAAGLLYPFTGFLLSPMVAAAAMAFSSVTVVLNSLRLKQMKIH